MVQGTSESEAVTALTGAWTTATLYADAVNRPPFVQAVERLTEWRGGGFDVRPSGFFRSGELLDGSEASVRLAATLSAHGVEWIGLDDELTPAALAAFFRLVALSPDVVEDEGGLETMVGAADLAGITVRLRMLLGADPGWFDLDDDGDHDDTVTIDASGAISFDLVTRAPMDADPVVTPDEPEATDVTPTEPSSVDDAAATPTAQPSTEVPLLGMLDAVVDHDDPEERTEALLELIDQFAELDARDRADLVARVLVVADHDARDLFLDQLAPHDVAALIADLDDDARPALTAYVASVTGARREELGEAIGDPASVLDFRTRVAATVQERLDGIRATPFGQVAGLGVDRRGWLAAATATLAHVAVHETHPDDLLRLGEAWRELVSAALRAHDDREAADWYRAVADLDPLPAGLADVVATVPSPDEIEALVARRADHQAAATAFIDDLLDRDAERVLGVLADDTDHVRQLAAADPDALVAALGQAPDPAVIIGALRAAGFRGNDPRLVELVDSDRFAARADLLELVGPSLGVERLGRLLVDPDPAVRRSAAEWLQRGRTPAGARLLYERFSDESLDDDEREALARHLAKLSDGIPLLEALVNRPGLLLSQAGRRTRSIAKAALDGGGR